MACNVYMKEGWLENTINNESQTTMQKCKDHDRSACSARKFGCFNIIGATSRQPDCEWNMVTIGLFFVCGSHFGLFIVCDMLIHQLVLF